MCGGRGVCSPKFLFGGLHTPLSPFSAPYQMILASLAINLEIQLPCGLSEKKNKARDSMETISQLIWNWAGHVTRRTDNRWTTRITFLTPRGPTRNRGRPRTRGRDDLNSGPVKVNGDSLCPTLCL